MWIKSHAVQSHPIQYSYSVIDGMALVRKIKGTGLTFNQLANDLLNTVLSTRIESTRIDVVFNVYKVIQLKMQKGNDDAKAAFISKKL